jgi:hypothetical protein
MLQEELLPLDITFKTMAVWLGILVLAIGNSGLREAVLMPEL